MRKNRALLFASIIAFAVVLEMFSGCESVKYKLPKQNLEIVTADGSSFIVEAELAKKEEERNWGYMERKKIPEGTGMLFIFEYDQMLNFWMKNTPTPLTIAFIDRYGVISDILDMTPYSLSGVPSSRSVRYALEVPQGWYKKNGIRVGDTVHVQGGKDLDSL